MASEPLAFPVGTIAGFTNEGMTLRDYFAGQALPAITRICISDTGAHDNYAIYCANRAYLFADAMLAVREASP